MSKRWIEKEHDVPTASSGEEVLQYLKESTLDLMLSVCAEASLCV